MNPDVPGVRGRHPLTRKIQPTVAGAGSVRFDGRDIAADYLIDGDPAKLRLGPARLRGSFKASADLALAAFRAGDGVLTLEDGALYRVLMLGHTADDERVFIELRV